jgi:hypothetical protein
VNYKVLEREFAERTRENLAYIDTAKGRGESVYEVTQLVNSLLGLLIFPQQRWYNRIPITPLNSLNDWPTIQQSSQYLTCNTVKELMRRFRNSITHGRVEFYSSRPDNEITEIRFQDKVTSDSPVVWEAIMTIEDVRLLAMKFSELMMNQPQEGNP